MKRILAGLLVGTISFGTGAWGAGLAIPEQGAAAMGMSASMTARNQDLSALYYNPAGLDFVQGFSLMIGDTPIAPSHTFSPLTAQKDLYEGAETNSSVFLPPHLYAAWRMNQTMVLGVGVNAPYGLGTDWESPGHYS